MTQQARLLEHFREHGSISQAEAFELYGIGRLSARVYDLRDAGHDVRKTMDEAVNRYGDPVRFARYWLVE